MKLHPTSGHECGVHVRRVHQVSIDVKPEGSILLQETVTRSHWRCVVLLRPSTSSHAGHEGCGLCLCVSQKRGNLCTSLLFDLRMTIKCAACSACYHGFHSTSHRHNVLLMHMRLINDAVHHEGSMRLIARCA